MSTKKSSLFEDGDNLAHLSLPVIGVAGLTQPAAGARPNVLEDARASALARALPGAPPPASATQSRDARSHPPSRWPVQFSGSGSEYFRIWVVNLLLTLVTFSLYYPWAKVRRLRYFYGNTQVAGHAFDFHGNPRSMLRGHLLIGVLLTVYSAAGNVSPTAGLIALLIIAPLWPLLYRASLRFKMSQTSWRGLRFQFDGSVAGAYIALLPVFLPSIAILVCLHFVNDGRADAAAAVRAADVELSVGAVRAAGFDATTASNASDHESATKTAADAAANVAAATDTGATVGVPPSFALIILLTAMGLALLATPLMVWALKHYQHSHYRLTSSRTRFDAGPASFYGVFLRTALVLLGAAVALLAVIGAAWGLLSSLWLGGDGTTAGGGAIVTVLVGVAGYVLLLMLAYPYFTSRMQNLVWSRTASRAFHFDSALRLRPLLVLTLKNWLLVVLTFGLYWPFAAIALAKLRLEAVTVLADVDFDQLFARQRDDINDATGEVAADMFGLDVGL